VAKWLCLCRTIRLRPAMPCENHGVSPVVGSRRVQILRGGDPGWAKASTLANAFADCRRLTGCVAFRMRGSRRRDLNSRPSDYKNRVRASLRIEA
jgi:hypothetical protein